MKTVPLFAKVHPYLSTTILIWAVIMTILVVAITHDFYEKQEGDLYLFSGNNPQYKQAATTTPASRAPELPEPSLYQ